MDSWQVDGFIYRLPVRLIRISKMLTYIASHENVYNTIVKHPSESYTYHLYTLYVFKKKKKNKENAAELSTDSEFIKQFHVCLNMFLLV